MPIYYALDLSVRTEQLLRLIDYLTNVHAFYALL